MNYSQLRVLNLGSNHLTGNIPSSIGSLTALLVLSLDKNNLSGDLPVSLQNCKYLMIVDFSENHLSGSLSNWLGNSSVDLSALVLRSNKFHGSIPQEICHFNFLQIVDLASNKLSGPIPRCFGNLSAMAEQSPTRTIIASGWEETVFLVTKGKEYEYGEMLSLVISMDLSSNNLIGEIPKELTGLYGVRFLNLSNNQLHGKIPENISAMKFLESLDISMNQLKGVIPQSMGTLTFLSYLNLSHNNFSGRIPSGTQLQSFGALSFIGNRDLCGPPLTPSCSGDDTPLKPIPNVDDEGGGDGDWIDMKWFCISVPLGFVVGFWGVVGPLAFNRAWRYAFFKYLDDIKYKLFGGGSEKRDSSTRAGAHSSKELPLTTPIQFSMPLLWAGKVGDPNPSQAGAHRISLPVKPQALVGIDGQNCHYMFTTKVITQSGFGSSLLPRTCVILKAGVERFKQT
ncbi:receptor-like protein EIX2 [Alnus glutinosa]|uniref:receptor-like protein EIX2 n=1 Tax=Alnus glutinosa TaxID=3517 RepID=UPI002D7883F9|nr:receptor-like protein EIX2 [Alnus glutinosa]